MNDELDADAAYEKRQEEYRSAFRKALEESGSHAEFVQHLSDARLEEMHELNNFHCALDPNQMNSLVMLIVLANAQGKIESEIELTHENMSTVITGLLEEGDEEKKQDFDRVMQMVAFVQHERLQHPELSELNLEECFKRAKKREQVVADFLFQCAKKLVLEEGYTMEEIQM